MGIRRDTPAAEIAARVSQALDAAGIKATLSGGGAVSIYTSNAYESKDLDFVTSERRETLLAALAPLGFVLASDRRYFSHPHTDIFLEFPLLPCSSAIELWSTMTCRAFSHRGDLCGSSLPRCALWIG